jgi:adenosine/AMP kinase
MRLNRQVCWAVAGFVTPAGNQIKLVPEVCHVFCATANPSRFSSQRQTWGAT